MISISYMSMFSCRTNTTPMNSLPTLCDDLLSDLEECLIFDLQLFADMCPACVHDILSSDQGSEGEWDRKVLEEQACLPCELLLKVVALCIQSSTTLRTQGKMLRI